MKKYNKLTKTAVFTVVALLFFMRGSSVFASEESVLNYAKGVSQSESKGWLDSEDDTPNYSSQLLVSVCFILVLGSIAWYLSKKLMPTVSAKASSGIVVKETARLGAGQNLHIVELPGEGKFLIGATNNNITLISKLEEK